MDKTTWDCKGLLIDLDGVIYVENQLIAGARETIDFLKKKDIPYRFMTNTTVKSVGNLHQKLLDLGIPADKDEIISPPRIAAQFLRQQGYPTCFKVLLDEAKEDFSEFEEDKINPDYIVVGKIKDRWNYDLMNKLFQMIVNGSTLLALHKDRYTETSNGLQIEFGAFIAGLEYATDKKAVVIGKPTLTFYQMALKDIGLNADDAVMFGDDLISDIQGAQNAGIKGVLVQTGKYREELIKQSPIEPDGIISSIAEVPRLFGN